MENDTFNLTNDFNTVEERVL